MATPRIVIRKENIKSNNEVLIYIKYVYKGTVKYWSTSQSVNFNNLLFESGINSKKKLNQQKFLSIKEPDYRNKIRKVGEVLNKIKGAIINIETLQQQPTIQRVKLELKKENIPPKEEIRDLFALFNGFLIASRTSKSSGTLRQYKVTQKNLTSFFGNISVDIGALNGQFYEAYKYFLIVEKKYQNNTVGNHIKTVKAFLNWCKEEGCILNIEPRTFKINRDQKIITYLTRAELQILSNFDLSANSRLV